ncbi:MULTISPECIES: branched-chain amino acid ABC transporter permease [Rhodococcus]|jgi:branched-chain amino acid transport system permease protein|uniref:branched-chain amino acid ABC transporter permease n=1 Tax=Rhodococcus TaxID=1827 RepID=UPI000BDD45DA|nr:MULTISPECIES: branched-chain amino acid ABC transporter permease [Rhodococcus]MBP1162197.1 branched-chain amino acid transport system permease protein [Rhodococcus sp. PvR099]MCZ4554883.1 branched-chain amino acid ABC transporter permease [Rhodococcus maanshanensis]PTR44892.1 amino acid/amide ABC transporter membrane protein 1 (HAAT family) [Rhodococcus sp. OK611]SNX89227.1 amino acid/amide ABC transporter membrane protein 1, HAAT family [Rhodococcus sp. OK270]
MTILWSGLALGAVYTLVAIGYNIVFVSSNTFNFAQAQLMMVGTFVAYTGLVTLKLPVLVVAVMATVTVMILAGLEEVIAVRPVKDHQNQLVTTLGVATLISGATQLIWGSEPLTVPFFGSNEPITLLGGRTYPVEIALLVLAIVLVVLLGQFSKRTVTGLALLGISEDREAAMLRGVNVRALALAAFAASGALAGFLGLFVGPKTFAVATLGSALAIKGFVALAIGGFGSLPGALVGGLTVGLVESYAALELGSEYSNIAVFVVLIVILMVRPAGLFGRVRERVV